MLPAEIRQQDGSKRDKSSTSTCRDRGEYRTAFGPAELPNEGVVDWLLACPVPIELGSTDTL